MPDNARLAGRLFDFVPAAIAKVAANSAATDLRRQLGASAVNIIADVSTDLCVPATVPATGSWVSPVIPSAGMTHISFAGKLTQGGNTVINRYADAAGVLLVASTTATITANSAFQVDVASTVLFQSFSIGISNTASAVATVSSYIGLLAKD